MSKIKIEWVRPPTIERYCITNIIVFLSNSIKGLSEVKKMSLISWPEFKKTIFEIYEHRILYSAEIMGVINNTYLSLDEHLIIFFGDGLFKSHGQ